MQRITRGGKTPVPARVVSEAKGPRSGAPASRPSWRPNELLALMASGIVKKLRRRICAADPAGPTPTRVGRQPAEDAVTARAVERSRGRGRDALMTAADEKGAPAGASRLGDSRYALAGSTLSDYAWRRMVDVAQRRAVMACEHRAPPRQPRARCPASLVDERPGLEIRWGMELGGRDDVSRWEMELGGRDDVRRCRSTSSIQPIALQSRRNRTRPAVRRVCALSRPRTSPACSDSSARPVAG